MAPTEGELAALARRAVELLDCEAQATVWWERRLAVGEHGVSDIVQATAELVALRGGRVGAAATTELSGRGLERAAAAALAHAELDREPVDARRLPDPAPLEPHDGWDEAVLGLDAAELAEALDDAAGDGLGLELRAGAARVAIASTRGVAAFEQRSFASAEALAPGRPAIAATGLAALDLEALVAAAEAGFHEGAPQSAEAGEPVVVLGPAAVAQVLDALKPELAGSEGAIAAHRGSRVAAAVVTLSDSSRAPGMLPRSADAEGLPRATVVLIDAGVARAYVADTATGGSTGHATRPGHAEPWPDHLVLAAGGAIAGRAGDARAANRVAQRAGHARDADALADGVANGLFVPAFLIGEHGWVLDGAQLIEGGERTWAVNGVADVDPLAVLAATEAVGAAQRLVPTDDDSALTVGGTLAPALRALGGVTIVG